jgi:hypothetical protein
MNNPPTVKTFTVELTVVLSALGDDSFDHVPSIVTYEFPGFDGATVVDETEQSFTQFDHEVVVQWSACFSTSLPVGDAVDALRNALTIGWVGNGCHGDHFESTGVQFTLCPDSIK